LLEFLVQQLENNNCDLLQASDECKQADDLEYAVVVLQAVTAMFRETEVLDSRAAVLMNKKEPVVSNLVALLLRYTDPKVTNPWSNKRMKESPENREVRKTWMMVPLWMLIGLYRYASLLRKFLTVSFLFCLNCFWLCSKYDIQRP
jgi:hypothetical protein